MSAVADGAESVERGDAQCGGEISVGATADGAFADREAHLRRERFGAGEESCAHFAFEGWAIEASGDFKAGTPVYCAESMQSSFQAAHIGNAQRAQIKSGAGAFGDHVGAGAAFDDAGVDGYAASKIVPFFDACELLRQFVDGVDAFLGRETSVRGTAMHGQFSDADALARRFQKSTRAERRFEDKDRIAAARFRFEELSGRLAADLFVGGPEEDEALAQFCVCFLKRVQGEERLNDSCLHVKNTRAVGLST